MEGLIKDLRSERLFFSEGRPKGLFHDKNLGAVNGDRHGEY